VEDSLDVFDDTDTLVGVLVVEIWRQQIFALQPENPQCQIDVNKAFCQRLLAIPAKFRMPECAF